MDDFKDLEPFEHKHEDVVKFHIEEYKKAMNYRNYTNSDIATLENSLNNIGKMFATSVGSSYSKKEQFNFINDEMSDDKIIVVNAHEHSVESQHKCPSCGSTDISFNEDSGKLRCNYCRCEFEEQKVRDLFCDVEELDKEIVIGTGSLDIENDATNLVTIKCGSCGAEIVVDTKDTMQSKCHWCRSVLSVNNKVPNGCVPDGVLPFKVTKEEAMEEFKLFLKGKRFFANSQFKRDFKKENIMGVYFPYMVVDTNAHINIKGQGETLIQKNVHENVTYFDVDTYDFERDFNLIIRGLTVEASQDKLDKEMKNNTNNIINSILPFDTNNAEAWNTNYMKGFSSEKRDINIENVQEQVKIQNTDIIKVQIKKALKKYRKRGYKLDSNLIDVKGQQWKTLYLPVWLYSFTENRGPQKIRHYIACNARTKETMGSVPCSKSKLAVISAAASFIALVFEVLVLHTIEYTPLCIGPLLFLIITAKYRNENARHSHETETRVNVKNMKETDDYSGRQLGLTNSRIKGETRGMIEGNKFSKNVKRV